MRFDLHRHLEGSHSAAALAAVAEQFQIAAFRDTTGGFLKEADLRPKVAMQGPAPFPVFYERIKFARQAYVSAEVIRELTRLSCLEAAAETDGFECRFSLFSMTKVLLENNAIAIDGVPDVAFADEHARSLIEAVIEGRNLAAATTGKRAVLRLGLSRSFERPAKYEAICAMAREYKDELVGLDVLGSPDPQGRAEGLPVELVRMLLEARKDLPDLTIHAGELTGHHAVVQALLLEPEAIGHGIHAVEDDGLLAELSAGRVTFELCPSSNELLAQDKVARLTQLRGAAPLTALQQRGVPCVLGSDDPTVFSTNFSRERQVAQAMGADLARIDADSAARWAVLTG